MGGTEDALVEILQRGLPKSEADVQRLVDKVQGKKAEGEQEEEAQPRAGAGTARR